MSSITSNVCGNCANFKLKQGEKFFNCTFAKHAGVPYAMQVQANTRSCEAFSALGQPPKPQTTVKSAQKPTPPKRIEPRLTGLCTWGRFILLAGLVIAIILLGWGAYSWLSHSSAPTPTPTPVPTTFPTTSGFLPTPTPAPTAIPITYYDLGTWVTSPNWLMIASNVQKTSTLFGVVQADPNTTWIVVTVTAEYTGTTSGLIGAGYFSLWDNSGSRYPATAQMTLMGNWFDFNITLHQGQVESGIIVYKVPTIASGLSIRLNAGTQYIAWNLGL